LYIGFRGRGSEACEVGVRPVDEIVMIRIAFAFEEGEGERRERGSVLSVFSKAIVTRFGGLSVIPFVSENFGEPPACAGCVNKYLRPIVHLRTECE
jgi:hypothetical protein